jgi:hypothetical protein
MTDGLSITQNARDFDAELILFFHGATHGTSYRYSQGEISTYSENGLCWFRRGMFFQGVHNVFARPLYIEDNDVFSVFKYERWNYRTDTIATRCFTLTASSSKVFQFQTERNPRELRFERTFVAELQNEHNSDMDIILNTLRYTGVLVSLHIVELARHFVCLMNGKWELYLPSW